jgi:AcrR family transcriptional regulator
MRRQPQQERGIRRVEEILNAAAELFGEIGFEAVTTNAIAARAKISIGSLYQFFPNKESIIITLSNRYHDQLRAKLDEIDTSHMTPGEYLLLLLHTLQQFYQEQSGFRTLFFGSYKAAYSTEIDSLLLTAIAPSFARLAQMYMPHLSSDEANLRAQILMTSLSRLLYYQMRVSESTRPRVLQEINQFFDHYLKSTYRE